MDFHDATGLDGFLGVEKDEERSMGLDAFDATDECVEEMGFSLITGTEEDTFSSTGGEIEMVSGLDEEDEVFFSSTGGEIVSDMEEDTFSSTGEETVSGMEEEDIFSSTGAEMEMVSGPDEEDANEDSSSTEVELVSGTEEDVNEDSSSIGGITDDGEDDSSTEGEDCFTWGEDMFRLKVFFPDEEDKDEEEHSRIGGKGAYE